VTRFIYKYLSAHFVLKSGKIIPQNRNTPYYYEVDNLRTLIEELSKVFGLTKKQLKYYIKGWALKQNRNFNFKEWWSPTPEPISNGGFGAVVLPMVTRINSQLLGQDLVAVQPLEAPRGLLFYMDYQVGRVDEPNQNGRVYPREQFQNAIENAEETNRNERIHGVLDHPQVDATTRMMGEWANLMLNQIHNERINELYRNQLAHIQRPV
jgi:hypothetical protein